ncbi:MAG: MucR family transcriptional regulator [Alphaproteobacteria bacterium]|jgi:predicted transcriptional regulator|nr:MAG: MucR family transcriptional regulator [Alphaproteobacteria bacterium]
MADNATTFIELTASIVSAYVSNHSVPASELPALIGQVHTALTRVSNGQADTLGDTLKPAIPIKKSVTSDYIVCLEDGKKFKSLKRHLRTHYKLTPEQYREKWGLGSDYPMVAPTYAAARSRLAKQMGLGQQRPGRK